MHSAFFPNFLHWSKFVNIYLCLRLSYTSQYHSIFIFFFRFPNNKNKNNQVDDQRVDFERVMYTGEFSNDKDTKEDVLPSDLKRLVEVEERQILRHQEATKM